MWVTSVRDLQWRWRRFVVGVLAAAMVFAVTLLMSGLADSLRHEASGTLTRLGGDSWVVASGGSGPFTSLSVFPQAVADTVRATAGVRAASPVAVVHQTIQRPRLVDVYWSASHLAVSGSRPRCGLADRCEAQARPWSIQPWATGWDSGSRSTTGRSSWSASGATSR
jgi:hypothetical protein